MSQLDEIRAHLERGGSITPMEALLFFGCFRLGARIYDLKAEGLEIQREIVTGFNGDYQPKRFARYWLAKDSGEGSR